LEIEKQEKEKSSKLLEQLVQTIKELKEQTIKDKEEINKLKEEIKEMKKDNEQYHMYQKNELLSEIFYSFRHSNIQPKHFYYQLLLDQFKHINHPYTPWSDVVKNYSMSIYVLGGYTVYQHIRGQEVPKDITKGFYYVLDYQNQPIPALRNMIKSIPKINVTQGFNIRSLLYDEISKNFG